MMEHTGHYVTTAAGTYHRFMSDESHYAVSAATLAIVARHPEDATFWYEAACKRNIVFW